MIQVFFERINTVNTACITFFAVTASFNDLYMMRDDIYPEDNAFYAVRPVAQALLILRNLINSVNLMIQTLQSENNNFNIALNSQIQNMVLNNTLNLVCQHHSGWNEFMRCQNFIITTIHPLELYSQFIINIEQHTDIIHMYCTTLAGILDKVRLLDVIIPWSITYNHDLLNIAASIYNNCDKILAQIELHYADQIRVLHNIQQL